MRRNFPHPVMTALFLALTLAACAHHDVVPPVLSLDGHACADQFDLIGAKSMQPKDIATIPVDDHAPCWQSGDGTKSTYAAVHLPAATEPYLAQVASIPEDGHQLPPRLFIVDFQGNVLRQTSREAFLTHGVQLSASSRIYPGDYALIVASDPASIGAQSSQIVGTTRGSTTTVTSAGGTAAFTVHTGDERALNTISSYNGIVIVTLKPIPQSN